MSGAPLETFVATTPKPLWTILYGIAFDITGDWSSLAVLPADGPAGLRIVDTETAAILVPRALINRLLVDLHTTQESWLGDNFLAFRARDPLAVVRHGQVVYHDRAGDLGSERFASFEIDGPTTVGQVRLEPLFVSPGDGVWVIGIGAGP